MLVIFDWDGTLIDSTGKIVGAMQAAIEGLGLPPLEDAPIQNIIGLGLPEAILKLYPHEPASVRESLRVGYSKAFVKADTVPCELYGGVETTLASLKNANMQLAVATGKSRKGLDRQLAKLGWADYFDATRCADETESKPSPLMLQQLLHELDVSVDRALMVGDTEYDLLMAKNAGMASVGVSYGAHSVAHLQTFDPVVIVDHMSELGNYVLGRL
ncbi:N-acetylmuramic acid 6-phosphate phosphatase [BD1-7 clade bacterium]|uniref:N-acetylmuramic acid 6-phosphate phosphatase n=1 Tax=BD1-7 clade bacterium TaxID=2029982 RepID=A0A5S9QN65_9GAMM|nr:N-acetylmuramic acid 6-phosphate phosphatase [BD1-7 clade bacterium]CAA0115963.1 N-acetylmuramic acid 6-phosphate phosphatase [BD1-7 clade bacterium]CAA0119624.1 N-acetylmuramic acid 6-phosphate phosphatase [BD1-7 clade bacterium]